MRRVVLSRLVGILLGSSALLAADAALAEEKPDRDFSFVAVPIPISSPAIGNGVALPLMALYRAGGSERPWTTGVAGLYTDTESWALAAGQKAYIADDRFRLLVGGGGGSFNVDFYGVGHAAGERDRSIPINEEAIGGVAELKMRVAPNIYVGPHYRLLDMRATFDLSEIPFEDMVLPDAQLRSTTSMLGLAAEFDTRDNEYQATEGLYATGTLLRAAKALGGDFDYTRLEASVNGYHRLDGKSVVAWRASICRTGDDAPFYDLCYYGSQSDLRGYVSGQYLDHAMYAVQAEYRRHLFWRLGAVAFAGVGSTASSFGKMSTDKLLPAAGVGLRVTASKEYGVNARIDYGWGKDSQALYISVGEAF